jgi:hypothetical protein
MFEHTEAAEYSPHRFYFAPGLILCRVGNLNREVSFNLERAAITQPTDFVPQAIGRFPVDIAIPALNNP